MSKSSINELIVYHDETKAVTGGKYKGHILFFVPKKVVKSHRTPLFGKTLEEYYPIENLFSQISEIRLKFHLDKKLHFHDISGKRWGKFDLGVRQIVNIGVDALRNKRPQVFDKPLCCKLAVIFYPRKSDTSFYGGESKKERQLRHDETVLRMLLKGAIHYLYKESEKALITRIISDGAPYHRKLDDGRVMWRITVDEIYGKTPLRDYAALSEEGKIIQLHSDHKEYDSNSEQYLHANMLQLADLMLGSVIKACHVGCISFPKPPPLETQVENKRDIIAHPVKEMLEKSKRGKGFLRSGHYRSFAISYLSFVADEVCFSDVRTKDVKITCDNLELTFP